MFHHKYKNALTISLRASVALGSLVALSGTAAHAGLTQYDPTTGSSALLTNGVTTAQYDLGFGTPAQIADGTLPSGYFVFAGANKVTFTSTTSTSSTAFEGYRNELVVTNGVTYPPLDYAYGTAADTAGEHLIDTFDPKSLGPSGPLEIDFSTAVGAFGFKSQSSRAPDLETFTFSVYDNSTLLGTFVTPTYSNTGGPNGFGTVDHGKSVFLGAQSTSSNITKVIISSVSDASGYLGGSNDFYTGPLTVGDPVPEASTMTGFGLGTLFFGGLFLVSRKRKSTQTSPV